VLFKLVKWLLVGGMVFTYPLGVNLAYEMFFLTYSNFNIESNEFHKPPTICPSSSVLPSLLLLLLKNRHPNVNNKIKKKIIIVVAAAIPEVIVACPKNNLFIF
jgi:hypothetical protein